MLVVEQSSQTEQGTAHRFLQVYALHSLQYIHTLIRHKHTQLASLLVTGKFNEFNLYHPNLIPHLQGQASQCP
jgi:hypothetical protein